MPIMFSELFKHPVVFTPVGGGRWIMPRSAVFNTLSAEEAAKDVILEVLAAGEVKVATIPEHVLRAIKSCCHINLATVTPSVVSQTYKIVQFSYSLPWDGKMALLKYMLKHNKYDLLEGLELLPLANGGFTAFCYNPRRAERLIYITTEEHPAALLPGFDDDILDQEVDADVKEKLVYAATRGMNILGVSPSSRPLFKSIIIHHICHHHHHHHLSLNPSLFIIVIIVTIIIIINIVIIIIIVVVVVIIVKSRSSTYESLWVIYDAKV